MIQYKNQTLAEIEGHKHNLYARERKITNQKIEQETSNFTNETLVADGINRVIRDNYITDQKTKQLQQLVTDIGADFYGTTNGFRL